MFVSKKHSMSAFQEKHVMNSFKNFYLTFILGLTTQAKKLSPEP